MTPRVEREAVRRQAEEVRQRLLRFSSHHMLANLMSFAFIEYLQEGLYTSPQVEFAALVYWHEREDSPGALPPRGAEVEEVRQAIAQLFFNVSLLFAQEAQEARLQLDQAEILHRIKASGLNVRVTAYEVHHKRVLDALFAPFASALSSQIGFNAEQVVACFDAIPPVIDDARDRFRANGGTLHDQAAYDAHFGKLGDYFAFDAETLADKAGVQTDAVRNILTAFAVQRGSLDDHALFPSPFSVLRDCPLLALGDGRFMVPNISLLTEAVRPRIESLLDTNRSKGGSASLWRRYEKNRAKWVENETLRLLSLMMPYGSGSVAAYYTYEGVRTESDVVYQVYDVVFIAEAKAGAFSPSTLRGSHIQLVRDLRETIIHGHKQSTRVEAYLKAGHRKFTDRTGSPLLSLNGLIRETFRIVVTLDSAGVLGAAVAEIQRAGYMVGDPTYFLSLTDLMIIADCLTLPGEFRRYIRLRYASLCDDRVIAHDETDLFGTYLTWNEVVPSLPGNVASIMLTDSAVLDAYFAKAEGSDPPHQMVPQSNRMLIQALAAQHDPVWSEAVCDLLHLGYHEREKFDEVLSQVLGAALSSPRDVTLTSPGDATHEGYDAARAITIVVQSGDDPGALRARFIRTISRSDRPVVRQRLIIGYNPASGFASAGYYARLNGRYVEVPPALWWASKITNL